MLTTSQPTHPTFLGVLIPVLLGITLTYGADFSLTQSPDNPSQGHINYETYRLLSTGMTEAEVLRRAGQPAQLYNGTCDDARRNAKRLIGGRGSWQCWTYYYDSWTVQLLLEGGRVVKIEDFKLP